MFKLLLFTFILLMSFGAAAEGVLNALNPFKSSSNIAAFCESAYENYRAADNYVPGATQVRVEIPGTPEKLQDGDLISIVSAVRLHRGEKKDIISDCTVRTNGKLQALNMTALSSVVSFEQTADLEAEKAKQNRFEGQVAACKKLKEDKQCTAFDIDAKNVTFVEDINKGILNNVSETDGCNCIKQVMKQAEMWNEKEFNEQKGLTQDRMQDSILAGFGKKFLNDYAANIEDVGYFQVNAAKFFGKEKGSQVSAAKNYECSDISQYESAIDKKCSANGITPDERQKRLNKIFNAYGTADGNDQMSLSQRFSKLNQKIQFLDDGQAGGKNGGYSRKDHDAKRFALSRKEDSIQLLDAFIKATISDSAKSSKLDESIDAYSGSPIGALAEFMLDEVNKNPAAFVQKFLSSRNLSSDYVKKSKQFLFDKKLSNDIKYQAIVTQIELGMGVHPGLKAMMTNKEIFFKAAKSAAVDGKSIVETLEKNDSVLGANYQKRCQGLIEKLSAATCMKSTDMIGKVSVDEIASLLKGKGYPENTKYELLVSCESGSEFTQKPFDDLVMKDPYTHSDLKDRLTKPANEQKNAFRRLHDSKDSAVTDKVESAIAETRSQREEVKDRSLASYKYAGNDGHAESTTNEIAPVQSLAQESSSRVAEVESSGMSSAATNFMPAPMVVPTTASAVAAVQETAKADLKSEVRDSLSNKDNQDKVEKLLSNTDDASMKELLRLKEESLKNRQKILELTSENEKQKLKDLEEKIRLLETKKQQIAQTQDVEEEEDVSVTRQRNTLRAPSRDIASLRPMMDTSGAASGDYGGTGGSSGGSFGSGGLAPTSGRGGSSAAAARSNVSADKSSDSSSDGYIVISNDGVSQGVKSQEVSQELINLLSSSDPDISALKKLKDSGMLYKFKVMENGVLVEKEVLVNYKMLNEDAKKLVESKLATKQHSQIDSELVAARRVHSFQALKIILGEQLRK